MNRVPSAPANLNIGKQVDSGSTKTPNPEKKRPTDPRLNKLGGAEQVKKQFDRFIRQKEKPEGLRDVDLQKIREKMYLGGSEDLGIEDFKEDNEIRALLRLQEARFQKVCLKEALAESRHLTKHPLGSISSRSFRTGQKGGPVIKEESSFKDQEPRFSSNLEAIRLSHPHISAQTSRSNQESFRILSGSRFGPLNSFLSKATTEASFKGVLKYGKNKASFEGLVSPKSAHDQEVLLRKLSVPETQPGFARVGPNPPSQRSPRSEAENEEPQRSIKNSQLNQASSPVVGQESTFMTGILSRRQMHQAKLSEVGTQSVKVHEYKPSDLSCAISTDQPMIGKLKDSPKPSPNYLLRTPLDPNTFGGLAEQTEKEIWKKKRSKRGREQKDGVFFNKIKHYSRIFNPKEKSSLVFGKLGKTAGGGLQATDVLETPHIGRMGNKPSQLNLAVGTSLKDKPAESRGSLETRSQFQRKKREIEQINERIITYSTFSVPNTAWGDYKPYQKEIEKIESKATGNLGSTKPMSVVELWSRDYHGDIMSKAEHKKFRMRIQRYLHVLHRQGQGNASISKLMLQTTTNPAKD